MRFASLGRSNAANYAGAGKAVADSSANVFDVQRKTGPDYGKLSQIAMVTQAEEKITAMKTAAKVTEQGIKNLRDKTKMQHGIAVFNDKKERFQKQRKAGAIAGLGKLAGAAFLATRNDKRVRPTNSDAKRDLLNKSIQQQNEILQKMDANDKAGLDDGDALLDGSGSNSGGTATGGGAGKALGGGSGSPNGTALGGSTLTGNARTVADAIAKYESGDWGYEAFNQGGAAGGTKVLGKSGSHKNTFGRSLTDMSLGEIFHKQNTKQRGLSMQQHIDEGGLHAVGRYQFIGSTLQDEVKRMGLDPNTKFTPEVQDQIFLSHVKRVGNISPWVGPMQNYSSAQRNQYNQMIQGL